jgi:hypothetical protein
MADFTYRGTLGGGEPEQRNFDVAAGGAATIAIGDIVLIANGYAATLADGEGTAGNGLYGLAIEASDETAGADGTCNCVFSTSGLIVEGTATTAGNLVTAVIFDKVTIDVAAGVQTVDENDAGALLIYEIDADSATTGLCRIVLPFNLAS